jgi:hypothetical protein
MQTKITRRRCQRCGEPDCLYFCLQCGTLVQPAVTQSEELEWVREYHTLLSKATGDWRENLLRWDQYPKHSAALLESGVQLCTLLDSRLMSHSDGYWPAQERLNEIAKRLKALPLDQTNKLSRVEFRQVLHASRQANRQNWIYGTAAIGSLLLAVAAVVIAITLIFK